MSSMNGREKSDRQPRSARKTKTGGPVSSRSGGSTARKSGGGLSEASLPDDDASSMGSYVSDEGDAAFGGPPTADLQLGDALDSLLEKRASVRITALEQLINLMTFQYMGEAIEDKIETLKQSLMTCIRKGDVPEIVLACRCLSLLAITLGTSISVDSVFTTARPVLETLIKDRSRNATARQAAISALALTCFIASDNLDDATALMSLFQDQYRGTTAPENVVAHSLESWGLLASTFPTYQLGGQVMNKNLPLLTTLLEHKSLDVRTAAGEDIALLYSAYLELHQHDITQEQKTMDDLTALGGPSNGVAFGDTIATPKLNPRHPTSLIVATVPSAVSVFNTPPMNSIYEHSPSQSINETGNMSPVTLSPISTSPRITAPTPMALSSRALFSSTATTTTVAPSRASSGTLSTSPPIPLPSGLSVDYEDLVAALEALATDGSKHRARKERAKQRSTFRDILHTVEDGDIPSETLTLGKRKYEFIGWAKIKQLSIIRDVLGKGMLHHFMENDLLGQIFEIHVQTEVDETEDRANRQANIAQSKSNQKDAYQRYTKQRKKKAAHLAADE